MVIHGTDTIRYRYRYRWLLVADCRKDRRGSIPAWLRGDKVLQLLEHMLREIAAADPERRP